jgi:hypothetical protein
MEAGGRMGKTPALIIHYSTFDVNLVIDVDDNRFSGVARAGDFPPAVNRAT